MADNVMLIGESFVGQGADAAHVNTVLGRRDGPVGVAWASALATPRPGNAAFVAVVRPGIPAKPLTLFVSKASVAGDQHAALTWGAAQAGVACGVADAVAGGTVTEAEADELLLIAAVWVNPAATDAAKVYANNRAATAAALRAGTAGDPSVAAMLAARDHPVNPYFDPAIAVPAAPAGP